MKQTIYDIAKKAKVSIATISRAMDPHTRRKVSPETLKRVDAVIRQHGYAPNAAAKGLTQSVFHTIGIVVPHGEGFFNNEYYLKILSGISDALLKSRYCFKLIMLKSQDRKWDAYPFRTAEGVDALVLTHWRVFFESEASLKKTGIPCLILGDPEKGVLATMVSADQEQGGRLAAEDLIRRGHKTFAVMNGSKGSVDSELRMKGFRDVLKARGLKLENRNILFGDFQETPAFHTAMNFLKKKPAVTAMFCANDTMAYGVLRAMGELKMKCPENLSIIGFDDDSRAVTASPPLTTVRVPLYEVAKTGCEKLLGILESRKAPAASMTLVPVELVERKSALSLK